MICSNCRSTIKWILSHVYTATVANTIGMILESFRPAMLYTADAHSNRVSSLAFSQMVINGPIIEETTHCKLT